MKKNFKRIISSLLVVFIGICLILPTNVYGRAHTSVHSSTHTLVRSSVKASTPSTTTKSSSSSVKASTPTSSTKSSSVSSSTPKTTTSSSTGKTYTTTKSETGRTTVNHETVKPKESTTIVNNNPTYYTNYSTQPSYSLSNSIFNYYMLSEIFKDKDKEKDKVSEQDIVKALEEKGYSKEEIDQILDEAKTEENENKPFYDGWKWYNWTIFIGIISILTIGLIALIVFICSL